MSSETKPQTGRSSRVEVNYRFEWLENDFISKAGYGIAVFVLGVLVPLIYTDLPLHVDEAVFLVIGEQIIQGTELYGGIADHKGPGIFMVSVVLHQLFETPYLAGRVTIYVVHIATAGAIGYLVSGIRSNRAAAIASLLYLGGVYLPHYDGYFFMTEPFANFFLVVAILGLLRGSIKGGLIAGVGFAVAGMFNQTTLLIGLPVLGLLFLRLRRETGPSGVRIAAWFVSTGIGFVAPLIIAAVYFLYQGTFAEALQYAVLIPLTGYETPFNLRGHLWAAVSYSPVWLLAIAAVLKSIFNYRRGIGTNDHKMFVIFWLVTLSIPGASAFDGDHKLLLAFPPAAILAAEVVEDLYERLFPLEPNRRITEESEMLSPAGRRRLEVGVWLATVGIIVLAASMNGVLLSDRVEQSITDQEAAVQAVDQEIDGTVHTIPFRHSVYYFGENLEPAETVVGHPYTDGLASDVVADLERQRVPYVVVPADRVDGEHEIQKVGYFVESRSKVIDYVNENYEHVGETEEYVIFRRR